MEEGPVSSNEVVGLASGLILYGISSITNDTDTIQDEATGKTHHLVAGDWAFFHVGSKAEWDLTVMSIWPLRTNLVSS
jgi:hypothetical protein